MATVAQRTWPVFLISFGTMLALIFVPGIAALRQSAEIYNEVRSIQRSHVRTQDALFRVERLVLQASVTVREFLLDDSPATAFMYREQVAVTRRALDETLKNLVESAPADQPATFTPLRRQIEAYWQSIMPVFAWSPAERKERVTYFLRELQRPRRDSILAIADETVHLSRENYRRRYEDLNASQSRYRRRLELGVGAALLLGLAVAIWTVVRISGLEGQAERQRLITERAEQQMRTLSARLMQAQEAERKTIARELHDEVGQMLTGLRMELGALERLNAVPTEEYREHLREAKTTSEQTLRIVRDIAIGLRPSVLDLGLESALRWQARQFSRSTGTEVNLQVNGTLDPLPDEHLTCVYRVVQEALTNSARHARAHNVEISVTTHDHQLTFTVADDGVGLPPEWNRERGMGLVGMEERVRELGGTFAIGNGHAGGVRIDVQLSLPGEGSV